MHLKITLWKRIVALSLACATVTIANITYAAESDLHAEVEALRQMLLEQQKTIQSLSAEVTTLKSELAQKEVTSDPSISNIHITPPKEGEPSLAASETPHPTLPPEEDPLTKKQESWLSFKHNDWAFEVYGYVKLDAAYDTQHTYNGDFARYVLPMSNGSDDAMNFTARQTRLGFKVNGPNWDGWTPSARVETDFYGDANASTPTLRLRLAYAQMQNEDWRIVLGQDWDALVVALPKTVNFATYNNQGAIWSRRPQAKAEWKTGVGDGKLKLIGAIASAEGADLDSNGQQDGTDAGIPNFEGTIAYEMPFNEDWSATVALGGAWGREEFHLKNGIETMHDTAVGVFTGILNWKDQVKLLGSIWTGKNVASFGGGIGQSVNLIQGTGIASSGGWVQLQTFPFEKWNWNAAFGMDDPSNSDLSVGMRSFNMDASTSVYYQMTSFLTLALEYSYLQTDYEQQASAHSHRIQSAVMLEF